MVQDFTVTYSKRKGSWDMSGHHFHDYYEIYYLVSGERRFYVENRSYLLKKGSVLFINKNNIHRSFNTEKNDHERINVFFAESLLTEFYPRHIGLLTSPFQLEHRMLQLNMMEQNLVESILFRMKTEYDTPSTGRTLGFMSLLAQFMLLAIRKIEENTVVDENPMHPKISEIIVYCNANFMNPLKLETISEMFFISPYYLSRLFKQTTHFTFTEYMNSLRIREAQRLLRETDKKIIEISELSGYSNISHFNRMFKQATGFTPMEYKKMATALDKP